MTPTTEKKRVSLADIRRAFRALGEVSRDPNRTDMVGMFIGSLTGVSGDRLFVRVWDDPVGRTLLEEGRDLRKTLTNRSYLSSLPPGTLGRAYCDWTAARDFTADGLADAISGQVPRDFGGPRPTMAARVVDMHDLWHVLNGWDSDILGEIHLLGYSYAQLGAYAWLILGLLSNLALVLGGHFEGLAYLLRAIRRGRRAGFLPAVDWEAMLPLPLDEVRRRLGVEEPTTYRRFSYQDLHELRRNAPAYKILRAVLPAARPRGARRDGEDTRVR
jgi:ubiquinone biosynthesis protein COQ4